MRKPPTHDAGVQTPTAQGKEESTHTPAPQYKNPGSYPPVFSLVAPYFWEQGMPVMPLRYRDKRPIEYQWSQWARTMPTQATRDLWMVKYPHVNIGLPAGEQSRCVFIDIDSPDPRVEAVIHAVLPKSPWVRVGQKGFVAAYRYSPDLDSSFKIKDNDNNMLVEFLSNGNQVVLPPSVHPKTQLPYTETCPLYTVVDQLPVMPPNFEKIVREALIQAGFDLSHSGLSKLTNYVPSGARDNTMVSMAGLFSMDITRGQLTLKEAIDRMDAWYTSLTEHVEGDALDIDKGRYKIVEFLQRDVTGDKKRPLPLGWDNDLDPEFRKELDDIFNKDHEEWTAIELRDYAYAEFMKYPDKNDPKRLASIEYVLERVSRSPSLSSLQKEQLYKYLCESGRVQGTTVATLKKYVKELQSGTIEGLDHTEIAKAVIEDLSKFGPLRLHMDLMWQWKGANWEKLNEMVILRHIAEEYGSLMAAKRSSDHAGIMKVVRNLLPRGLATAPLAGVNFANYFYTLRGEKLKHAPEFGATYTLPYRHAPEAATSAPLFQKLLHDAWGGDPDYYNKVQALREFIATTMTGTAYLYQRVVLLYGLGSTGKSTILQIIKALLPEEVISVVAPRDWGDKFAPTMMAEKLLNVAGELHEKYLIDGEKFKQVVDGSEMFGQYKGQALFKFTPKAAQWFASNHLPRTLDTSSGFNRRWLILEFNKPVKSENKILGLDTKIIADEREAIVAWALESLPELTARNEYTIPFSSELMTNEMACENNSVRFFLTECPKVRTTSKNRLKQIEQLIYGAGDTRITMSLEGLANPKLNQKIFLPDNDSSLPNGTHLNINDSNATPEPHPSTLSPDAKALLQSSGKVSKNPQVSGMSSATLNALKTSKMGTSSNGSNLISEEVLHRTYLEYSSQTGGVRAVGLRMFKKQMLELKHEMNFTVHRAKTDMGVEKHLYEGLTLA